MKKKMRKFADGGFSTAEGENKNIDDDVRSRAMKFVEDASEESRDIGAPVTRSAAKSTSKVSQTVAPAKSSAPAAKAKDEPKPKAETREENKARMEDLTKKQALERVEPENYIPGTGLLKNVLKRGLKTIGAAKQLENNPTKRIGLDKSMYKSPVEKAREARASARKSKMKQENYDAGPAGRARSSGAMVDDLTPGGADLLSTQLRPDFKRGGKVKANTSYKSGGSVKSSASRRADGCAVRGKTRA